MDTENKIIKKTEALLYREMTKNANSAQDKKFIKKMQILKNKWKGNEISTVSNHINVATCCSN